MRQPLSTGGLSEACQRPAPKQRPLRTCLSTFPKPQGHLAPHEVRVALLVADGWSNKAIAEKLLLSEATVKSFLGKMYAKLGVSNKENPRMALAFRVKEFQLAGCGTCVFRLFAQRVQTDAKEILESHSLEVATG